MAAEACTLITYGVHAAAAAIASPVAKGIVYAVFRKPFHIDALAFLEGAVEGIIVTLFFCGVVSGL